MKRKIINRETYQPRNSPTKRPCSVVLTLECGHIKRLKMSEDMKRKGNTVLCRECDR